MKASLVLAIGKYDVRLDGKNLPSPLSEGKEIWDDFDSLKDHISLPLIRPALEELDKIIRYEIDSSGKLSHLSKIFIVATEQAKAGLKSNEKDTIWFARIIQRILESRWRIKSTKIEILLLSELSFPAVNLAVKKLEKSFKQEDHIFLKLDGSLPFLGMVITSRLALRYENRVRIIRISDASQAVEDYSSVQELLRIMRMRNTMLLIENYQYSACLSLYQPEETDYQVFRFLTAWKNMDFELAEYLLNNRLSAEFHRMFRDLFLIPKSIPEALSELLHNMEMQLEAGEYVDVLGRLYSFRENLLKYGLFKLSEYPLDAAPEQNARAAHLAFLNQNPELLAYLKSRRENGCELRYEEMSFRVLRWMLRFYAKADKQAGRLYTLLNKLDEALEYRNQTIIGHGFHGCSRVILEDKLKMEIPGIMDYLKRILQLLDIELRPNPFESVNTLLLERYDNLS